jgi:DNA polymerase
MDKYGISNKFTGISKVHGEIFETNSEYGNIKIIPVYHPAAATYNPNMKKIMIEDFKKIKETL